MHLSAGMQHLPSLRLLAPSQYLCVCNVTHLCRGGICRYVLAKTTSDDEVDLDTAMDSANLDVLMSFAAKKLNYNDDMPHSLLHFVVNEQFRVTGIVFASVHVSRTMLMRIAHKEKADVRRLVCATEGEKTYGALRGLLFEEVAHEVLQRGGAFPFVCLYTAAAAAAAAPATIENNLKAVTFRTAEEFGAVAVPGVYARPEGKNFATVDAVIIPSHVAAPVMFLQMTVSTDHPIKHAALQRMRENLPAALKGRPVQFVFVVPEDVAVNFKKQPFHTVQHTVMVNPPADVPQHLLVVRLATQPN